MLRKKLVTFYVLAIFLLSIGVFASQHEERAMEKEKSMAERSDKIKELKKEHQEKLDRLKEDERKKLETLDKERLEKLTALKEERLKKITALREDQIKKLAAVKAERLKKMAGLSEEQLKKIALLDARQLDKLASLDRARLNEIAKLSHPQIIARVVKLETKKLDKELGFGERKIAKEKSDSAKKGFKEKEDAYSKLKEDFKAEKKAFDDAKTAGKDAEALEHAKKYLLRLADAIINKLERIKEKVSSSDKLTDAEESEIIADIDAKIKEISDAKAEVEKATTRDELKNAGKSIIKTWKAIKHRIKKHLLRLEHANVHAVIKRAEHLENRLEKVLAEMEEKGIKVEGIDAKVTEFSGMVNSARTLFGDAQEAFKQAKAIREEDSEKAQELVKKSRDLLQQAQQKLKSAHDILVDIVKEIKNSGGNETAVESTEIEADAEVVS